MFDNQWTVNGSEVRVNIPFAKVNKERRTVSGFATLDNVDTHGDVVDADASTKAFSRFRGNLREMHQPLAVGKVVDFQTQEFSDPEDSSKKYRGVFVTAYVSKGAQDTWEKVLDGTLSGFSIGGVIKKKELGKSADGGSFNIIKEYDLIELSLVDNPANQLANVFSIQKFNDGTSMASGFAVETKVKNVLYNRQDDVVILSDDEEREGFENAGWVEDNDEAMAKAADVLSNYKKKYLEGSIDNKVEEVRREWYKQHRTSSGTGPYDESDEYVMSVFEGFVITRSGDDHYRYTYTASEDGYSFGDKTEVEITTQISEKSASTEKAGEQSSETSSLEKNEGGANMATEDKKDETPEQVVDPNTPAQEDEKQNPAVTEAPAEEVEDDATEKAAAIDEVAPTAEVDVEAIVAKAVSAALTAVKAEETEKSADSPKEEEKDEVTKAVEALTAQVSELTKAVGSIDELSERLDAVESGGAVKKSADDVDTDDVEDDDEGNIWKGGFLGTGALTK